MNFENNHLMEARADSQANVLITFVKFIGSFLFTNSLIILMFTQFNWWIFASWILSMYFSYRYSKKLREALHIQQRIITISNYYRM